ncbi:proline-rich extensin-like protein EPR1 [Penaeus chinensis]|uniref:proline-rich extensin-like protein EPR1 n=1 Tax=Penaeus chinensis TaxID=139456 RepID=UPI001FB84620|nr:proline-rich extensin-like protein EPR1 [Penaeus chinensis]
MSTVVCNEWACAPGVPPTPKRRLINLMDMTLTITPTLVPAHAQRMADISQPPPHPPKRLPSQTTPTHKPRPPSNHAHPQTTPTLKPRPPPNHAYPQTTPTLKPRPPTNHAHPQTTPTLKPRPPPNHAHPQTTPTLKLRPPSNHAHPQTTPTLKPRPPTNHNPSPRASTTALFGRHQPQPQPLVPQELAAKTEIISAEMKLSPCHKLDP